MVAEQFVDQATLADEPPVSDPVWDPDPASTALTSQRILDIAFTPMADRQRNDLITVTYQELADALGEVLTPGANWCTFSQWPSRTVGHLLGLPIPGLGRVIGRAFGHGNRGVFADIGQVMVAFLEEQRDRGMARPRDAHGLVQASLARIAATPRQVRMYPIDDPDRQLTVEGVLQRAVCPRSGITPELGLGVACYALSLITEDKSVRAQRIWAGNVALAAHEQRWLDRSLAAGVRMPIRRVLHPELNLKTVRDARMTVIADGPLLQLEERLIHLVTQRAIGFSFNGSWVGVGGSRPDASDEPLDVAVLDPCARVVATRWPRRSSVDCWLSLEQRVGFIAGLFWDHRHAEIGHPLTGGQVAHIRAAAGEIVAPSPAPARPRPPDALLDPLRQQVDPAAGATPVIEDTAREVAGVVFGAEGTSDAVTRLRADDAGRWSDLVACGLIDRATLVRGAEFYDRHRMVVNAALLFGSLPDGFCAAEGVQVFSKLSRFETNPVRRTGETAHFVLDVLRGDLHRPRSEGRRSIMKVRALHDALRRALELGGWDRTTLGRPFNQEDLLGTVLSFIVPVFELMERLGVDATDAERQAYTSTWCAVGHLLGVELDLLLSEGGDAFLTPKEAAALAARIRTRHRARNRQGTVMMEALLQDVADHFPVGFGRLPDVLSCVLGDPEVTSLLMVPWQRQPLVEAPVRAVVGILRAPVLDRILPPVLGWVGDRWLRSFQRQDFRDVLTQAGPPPPRTCLPDGCLDEADSADPLQEIVEALTPS